MAPRLHLRLLMALLSHLLGMDSSPSPLQLWAQSQLQTLPQLPLVAATVLSWHLVVL